MQLIVTRTFAVADLGTIAFVEIEPDALSPGARHRCVVSCPDGEPLEAVASVESVRAESTGDEFLALLFSTLSLREITPGATIAILGEALY